MIKSFLYKFMYGRYGTDQLNLALMFLYITLVILNLFFRSLVISLIILAILGYQLFRSFSKNVNARRKENQAFLKVWNRIKKWFSFNIRRFKERKDYRYHACPYCKAMLRFPNRKGNHTVKCPRCRKEFNVKI